MDWWQAGSVMGTVVLATTAKPCGAISARTCSGGRRSLPPTTHRPTAKLSPAR